VSRWSRLATLGNLTSKVSASYLGNKVREAFLDDSAKKEARDKLHVENAEHIADTLSKMKGAAMKLGQQLASVASTLDLPDDVAATLSKLNSKAEPIPFEQIRDPSSPSSASRSTSCSPGSNVIPSARPASARRTQRRCPTAPRSW
jgi:predicted unusual protein kinase regulating ubiquinone biosynthesis (AarF/ABC1/UbiB family)